MFSNWQNSQCYFVFFPACKRKVSLKYRKALFKNRASISLFQTIFVEGSVVYFIFFHNYEIKSSLAQKTFSSETSS